MTVLAPLYPNHLLRALTPNTSTLGGSHHIILRETQTYSLYKCLVIPVIKRREMDTQVHTVTKW